MHTKLEENYSSFTFGTIARYYVSNHLSKSKAYRNTSYINNLTAKWGEHNLTSITPSKVRKWIKELLDSKYEISTVEKHLVYFKRVFNYSIEMELIPRNPITHISFKKEFKKKNRRNTTINHQEYKELLELFKDSKWYTVGTVVMLWHTGMRVSEVLNLKWDSVDLPNGVITLSPEDVKEQKVRTIGLEKEVIQLLRKLKNENNRKGAKAKDHVFGITKNNPQSYQSFYHNYKKVVKGTKFKNLLIHDIRHCYTKRKRQEGSDREVIKIQQGHSSDSMFNWYNDIDVDEVTAMSGFNEEKRDLIQDHVEKISKVVKQHGIPIGTLHAALRENL